MDVNTCFDSLELSFYPQYDENEWSHNWIEEIGNHTINSYDLISEYIPLTSYPKLIFISRKYTTSILKEIGLPNWVSAFTIDETIYILFDCKNLKWKSIIDHEMFHARLNLFIKNKSLLPDWFNEAIAYHIGKNLDFDTSNLYKYVSENYKKVCTWILEDQLLMQNSIGFDVIKSLGGYIYCEYGSKKIKSLIEEMKKFNNFNLALNKAFSVDMSSFIKKWHHDLIRTHNL